jgi:hypothetical protein
MVVLMEENKSDSEIRSRTVGSNEEEPKIWETQFARNKVWSKQERSRWLALNHCLHPSCQMQNLIGRP